jgi:hypothetical protein
MGERMNGGRAESPTINSAGQRPANGSRPIHQALKGRNQMDFAPLGLSGDRHVSSTGRCPVLLMTLFQSFFQKRYIPFIPHLLIIP